MVQVRMVPPHLLRPGDFLAYLGEVVASVSEPRRNPDDVYAPLYRVITCESGREVRKNEGEQCRVSKR